MDSKHPGHFVIPGEEGSGEANNEKTTEALRRGITNK